MFDSEHKLKVKVCLGTTCFVMGAANLQELLEAVPQRYGDRVEVIGEPCLGLCSIDWKFSKAPYVKVGSELIHEATIDKVMDVIDKILGESGRDSGKEKLLSNHID